MGLLLHPFTAKDFDYKFKVLDRHPFPTSTVSIVTTFSVLRALVEVLFIQLNSNSSFVSNTFTIRLLTSIEMDWNL